MPRRLLPDAVLLLLAIAAVALVLASVLLLHELLGAADGLAPIGAGAVAGPPAP